MIMLIIKITKNNDSNNNIILTLLEIVREKYLDEHFK